jgi:hypothetical protein
MEEPERPVGFPEKRIVTEEMIMARDWHRKPGPFYRVIEASKFFFGMSPSWLRLKMKADVRHPMTWFVYDGRPMEFRRLDPDKSDSGRVFLLSDIEPMAYSLYRFDAIKEARFNKILGLIRDSADLYDLLDASEKKTNKIVLHVREAIDTYSIFGEEAKIKKIPDLIRDAVERYGAPEDEDQDPE